MWPCAAYPPRRAVGAARYSMTVPMALASSTPSVRVMYAHLPCRGLSPIHVHTFVGPRAAGMTILIGTSFSEIWDGSFGSPAVPDGGGVGTTEQAIDVYAAGHTLRQASDLPQPPYTDARYDAASCLRCSTGACDKSRASGTMAAMPPNAPCVLKLGHTSRQSPHCRQRDASYAIFHRRLESSDEPSSYAPA